VKRLFSQNSEAFLLGALGLVGTAVLLFALAWVWLLTSISQSSGSEALELGGISGQELSGDAAAIATLLAAPTRPPADTSTTANTAATGSDPVALGYDLAVVEEGYNTFVAACSACHGVDARGLPNLGKDLIASEFVRSQSDAELMNFVKMGRPIWDPANTTGIDMPPKGGNPALTDDQLTLIITYLRATSGVPAAASAESSTPEAVAQTSPNSTPIAEAGVATNPSPTPRPSPTTSSPSAGSAPPSAGSSSEDGAALFTAACSACHGLDAHGLPNLGKDLVVSEFVRGLSDPDLLNFIKTGRPLWDPANTTGIDMPPKGGNPALTDEQIMAIIGHIRSLQAGG
jgi:disulfide bond formation protein DsbB